MAGKHVVPLGVPVRGDIEKRDRAKPFRARVRWTDPATGARPSKSESFDTEDEAQEWLDKIKRAASRGVDPRTATAKLADYGEANMDFAMRGVEPKTLDPYLAGWRKRVVPTVGHLPVTMITGRYCGSCRVCLDRGWVRKIDGQELVGRVRAGHGTGRA